MKKRVIIIAILGLCIIGGGICIKKNVYNSKYKSENVKEQVKQFLENKELRNGDIIFQTSLSNQSIAIQRATKSKYSHCGIIYIEKGKCYVFEAIQPVQRTPLDQWILRGKDAHFVVKRLKNATQVLTSANLDKMRREGERLRGKSYDLAFEWTDDKIYCSELIWKVYKRATGIEVGGLQKLGDFDLRDKAVAQKIKERYGNIIPKDEIVISPASIFDSSLLETVKSN